MQMKPWLFGLSLVLSGTSWAGCTVTPPLAPLGQYDPATGSSVRQQFSMSISCSEMTSFTITAGPSQTTGSISNRQLRGENPSSLLRYQLCLDANWGGPCNTIFGTPPDGNALSGTTTRPGTIALAYFWVLVYGDQPAMPGWHDDYVVITVSP